MAPRTPEQQAAYNEKRRQAAADARTTAKAEDKAIAPKGEKVSLATAVKQKADKVARIQKAEKVHKAKVAAKPRVEVKQVKGKTTVKVDGRSVPVKRVALGKPVAQKMGNKFVSEPQTRSAKGPKLSQQKPKVDIAKQVKALGADSLLPPDDPKAGLLMAKSHRREFRGNGATQRGTGWQVTVMFTEDQLNVLKERAGLYNVSLSEAVRRCVMSGPLPE